MLADHCVPRLLLFQCCDRLSPAPAVGGPAGLWLGEGTGLEDRLRALLEAVDPAVMLLALCGWQVDRAELWAPGGGGPVREVIDLAASGFAKVLGDGPEDGAWVVPVSTAAASVAMTADAAWEVRLVVRAHPRVADRFRVALDGLGYLVHVESGAETTIVEAVTDDTPIGADGAFARLCVRPNCLCQQLADRLDDVLARGTDLDRPADRSGLLGLFATAEWRPGRLGSAKIVGRWQQWFAPLGEWIAANRLGGAAAVEDQRALWQGLAQPHGQYGGRSFDEDVEAMRGTRHYIDLLWLVDVYRAIEDNLRAEGRWRAEGLFEYGLPGALSLGHVLMLLGNEGVIDTLAAVAIDVEAAALAILDAVAGGHAPTDDELRVLASFVRQFPSHARLREAVDVLVAAAPGRAVELREEIYDALLVLCRSAVYEETSGRTYVTVVECVGWLRAVLLTEVPDDELDGFLAALAASIDRELADTGPTVGVRDDRFVRVLLDFAALHPDEAVQYADARAAAGHYVAFDGIGRTDPGDALLRARFEDLCKVTVSCLDWNHRAADPTNQLADDLLALLGRLGLAAPGLEAIDWAAVDQDARQRVVDALEQDGGGLRSPADARDASSGVYDLRDSEKYLLALAALELLADAGRDPGLSAGARRRLDPVSAARYLQSFERVGVVHDILAAEPRAALEQAVQETFGAAATVDSVTDAHVARLLDPLTVAWAATLGPDDRQGFVDARLTSLLAVDRERALDTAAQLGALVAAADPAGMLVDLSPVEQDRFADLVAEAAPQGASTNDARTWAKALQKATAPLPHAGRAWLAWQEQPTKAAMTSVFTDGQRAVARERLVAYTAGRYPAFRPQLEELEQATATVQVRLDAIETWKVGARSAGALVSTYSLVVRLLADDDITPSDWPGIAKDVCSLLDHVGSAAGSRLVFDFASTTKTLFRIPGRVLGPLADFALFIVYTAAAVDHYSKGEIAEGTLDLAYAGLALTSAVVGVYVLCTAGITAEAPPVALAILAVGGALTLGLFVYETFFMHAGEDAAAFVAGLEAWLVTVRIVYPEETALYPPAFADTTGHATGGAGFYGDRPVQDPVLLDWDDGLTGGRAIVEGDLLGRFLPWAGGTGSWDGADEFRAPLSGTFLRVVPGNPFASGDAVLYLEPDFSDRLPEPTP